MIKKYFEHMHTKSTHERREHALRLAGGITAFALLVWVTTLGLRFASTTPAQTADSGSSAQVASVAEATEGNATLMVATSSDPFNQ